MLSSANKVFPRTPYPTLTESMSFSESERMDVKRHQIVMSPRAVRYSPTDMCYNFSSAEMMKACQSVLGQIDWSKVVLDVVGKETSVIYHNTCKRILQAQIERMLKNGCHRNIYEGRERRDVEEMNDTDAGGGTSDSDMSWDERDSFVESDDNECGSAEYHHEEDSEDEENEGGTEEDGMESEEDGLEGDSVGE